MRRLLERNIASIDRRLVLLAPPQAVVPEAFSRVTVDSNYHALMLREMQSMRGAVYLSEGNITAEQLTADGRHETPEDERSWHLLMTDGYDHVSSCAWYRDYENTVSMEHLRVRSCPLHQDAEWRERLEGAVDAEIAHARREGLRFAELGGWAILKDHRCSPEGLMIALATYGLGRMLGGGRGITTANVMHSCSSILRRMGGSALEHDGVEIPAYFDPRYNTNIELLRFESRKPSTKYASFIDIVKSRLLNVPVIARALDCEAAAPHLTIGGAAPVLAA